MNVQRDADIFELLEEFILSGNTIENEFTRPDSLKKTYKLSQGIEPSKVKELNARGYSLDCSEQTGFISITDKTQKATLYAFSYNNMDFLKQILPWLKRQNKLFASLSFLFACAGILFFFLGYVQIENYLTALNLVSLIPYLLQSISVNMIILNTVVSGFVVIFNAVFYALLIFMIADISINCKNLSNFVFFSVVFCSSFSFFCVMALFFSNESIVCIASLLVTILFFLTLCLWNKRQVASLFVTLIGLSIMIYPLFFLTELVLNVRLNLFKHVNIFYYLIGGGIISLLFSLSPLVFTANPINFSLKKNETEKNKAKKINSSLAFFVGTISFGILFFMSLAIGIKIHLHFIKVSYIGEYYQRTYIPSTVAKKHPEVFKQIHYDNKKQVADVWVALQTKDLMVIKSSEAAKRAFVFQKNPYAYLGDNSTVDIKKFSPTHKKSAEDRP